ncbi:MAG TPA: hypothetical protein VG167_05950 [Verrucomicrobiae bacterium]|nr:hypothetical protein [Verrucomicrobiae bacterium]
MKFSVSAPKLIGNRPCRLAHPNLLSALLAATLLAQAPLASAALSFGRGTPTTVGSVRFSSSPDSVTITAALTGPGTITSGLSITANRIQYDVINSDQGPMFNWTLYYLPSVGPSIIGAYTPLGYITLGGVIVPEGGYAYTTLFNAGFGVYAYNAGAPWTIDYEPDHITFSTAATPPGGLPANDGLGFLNPTAYLPSFAVLFSPALPNGLVPAKAGVATAILNGQVYGPLPGNSCLSILCSNLVVETCSNCVPVDFSAFAVDTCCTNAVLQYQPPSGTCFPLNSMNTVTVVASDSCGNLATNYFTVTVVLGANCLPTNCISISASNLVVYTCNPCTPVLYNVTAVDACCPGTVPTLTFNPPETTCFPVNSTTPVLVTAYDQCGNTTTKSFTVTVLPGPNCGATNCISIFSSNLVAYTCSNCTTVPFTASAFDSCCTNLNLLYYPPTNTCFPLNSTTPAEVIAYDSCGNAATNYFTITVLPGPNCGGTNCISLYTSNLVAYTCSNCLTVSFPVSAVDTCCPIAGGPTLTYNPPETTCFPVNSTTPVLVTAQDACGNTATTSFTVTILPGPNCGGTNCISLYTSNLVVYTCSNCVTVPYAAFAYDSCCTNLNLLYNPPTNTCFPLNSTTPVQVMAIDDCGHVATNYFTVTVLPGPNCGGSGTNLSITGTTGPGGSATNYITVWWPTGNAQLQQSADLLHWSPIPGATNSPYVIPNTSRMNFYRLHYH